MDNDKAKAPEDYECTCDLCTSRRKGQAMWEAYEGPLWASTWVDSHGNVLSLQRLDSPVPTEAEARTEQAFWWDYEPMRSRLDESGFTRGEPVRFMPTDGLDGRKHWVATGPAVMVAGYGLAILHAGPALDALKAEPERTGWDPDDPDNLHPEEPGEINPEVRN